MTKINDYPVLVICGPTASGKTRIGIDVAKELTGEIISADARQFYQLMDIGTAKPTLEERAEVPHHLVDFADINEQITAADFRTMALDCIKQIIERGNIPIIVGGSGLYIRALEEGFFEGPKADYKFRRVQEFKIEKYGIEKLHKILKKVDPETAERLSPKDKSRIIRALEVFKSEGKGITQLQRERSSPSTNYMFIKIGIRWPRDILYQRINQRVAHMVNCGLVDEVKVVYENLHSKSSKIFKALSYREFRKHLEGEYDLERAIYLTQLHTRHYAKRQITWFKADPDIKWFDPMQEGIVDRLVDYYRKRSNLQSPESKI
ncbi:MAG: tRNA (adenosine(37)-N6)-dimethylallyltransferase MiaA [candidate division Zixibacteria bacterium]|nr:tRNA (adenosine(37)-N6)-dimethylallyltransferase MiaA [candidate division Zixibacteria bacterium]